MLADKELEFSIEAEDRGGWTVVAVRGDLDAHSAPGLRAALGDLVEAGRRDLVVDLSRVPFVDASGLGALVASLKKARVAEGDLRLVGSPRLGRVLEMSNLHVAFPLWGSVDEALDGAQPAATRGRGEDT